MNCAILPRAWPVATRLPHFFCHEAPEQDLSREATWLERPPYYKELGVEMTKPALKVDHVWGDCTSIGSRICPLLARLTVRLGCQSGYARLPFLSCIRLAPCVVVQLKLLTEDITNVAQSRKSRRPSELKAKAQT